MISGKFGTVINCIDGRVQIPVSNWIKENYHFLALIYLTYYTNIPCDNFAKTLYNKKMNYGSDFC